MAGTIRTARIYDTAGPDDGVRVLVDRLWPRGLTKSAARLDHWMRDVAPSTELRRWYSHDSDRFAEFDTRYRAELAGPGSAEALAQLRKLAADGTVTLLTSAKEVEISHVAVLVAMLRDQ
ncbi:DUF488 domain-containing protein [Krasilnikovia sp. MM14-A1004]|uniref:DUF488 domain-containing protein n=1 Tax=Krasilnikovia sp. MM14-A1004 TaxID=3373541 RepID=UPI00399CB708